VQTFFIFILILTASALYSDKNIDPSYLYQNGIDIDVIVKDLSVKVLRKKDKQLLIDTKGESFYIDKSNKALEISCHIVTQTGGFDVICKVKNTGSKTELMPDLQIPGINFKENRYLYVLNTNTKQYMEKRDLKNSGKNYISVSSFRQTDKRGVVKEKEIPYASDTLSPYSPVIAVVDKDFAVGTSLNYPLLKYIDNSKKDRGKHRVIMNKLYPKMRIYKDGKSWRFVYSFDKEGLLKGTIEAGKTYSFTIPVRFSKPRYWLLTLHPYKEYFLKQYPIQNPLRKDVTPILLVNFSFYGDSVTEKNRRGWAWNLENIDKNGYSYLPLKQVSYGLSTVMKQKGYKRILFVTFSGVYNAYKSPDLYDELPFEFITKLEPNMQKELDASLDIYKKAGQKFGFWWGIAGMMPVDKNGAVIDIDTWQPYSDTPFVLSNTSHLKYAKRELKEAVAQKSDSLYLDAYVRMEENDRLKWLKYMKKYAPKIKFVVEEQVDFMHTVAAIILQPYNSLFENIDYSKSILTQPAVFSHYLNPKSEVQVWLNQNLKPNITPYIKKLVKWGYTPIIQMPSGNIYDHDETNVSKRIIDNSNYFIPVYDLDNSKIAECFDGVDNDKDGLIDWPYDDGCTTASDESE